MSSEFHWPDAATAEAGDEDVDQPDVLLLTLLETELSGAGGEHITLHAPTADANGGETALSCADCGREFENHVSLTSHRTHEHSGAPPHSCPLCPKTFQRRTDLKNHMNLHLGIKKSVCDVCGRQFSHMSNLYRHRRIHTGERPYVCSICGKRFSQVNALNAHKSTHETRTANDFKCPSCPKKFRNRPRLACHVRLMHQTAEQPGRRRHVRRHFHCGVCGARFPSRGQLLRHQASHSADSLRCGVCQAAFGSAEEEEPPGLLVASRADHDAEVGRLMDEMGTVHTVGTQYDVTEILCLPTVP
ncbi:gastrula zinc finger protein XlCGF7.1-like [Pollicipes pollicipes]|uniref:gastrula zinc finger protein XlCGF7.1-like n=1 Tax=Pollicipes pollicipes TaxID=41117 RepID=UPI001884D165|nr:gastrula zinc finger protein XlCGF7.1-like [Pollicipes pollicipes]